MPLNESVPMNEELKETLVASELTEPEKLLLQREIFDHFQKNNDKIFSELELKVLSEKMKGLDYKEIAEKLGKTPKSIDNSLQRIKKKIVSYLEK